MSAEIKNVKYPENRYLKLEVVKADRTITDLANEIGCSREVLSMTVNGHYKGENIVPRLKQVLGLN